MHLAKLVLVATAGAAASSTIALAAAQTGSQPLEPGSGLPSNAASQAQAHAAPVLAQRPSASEKSNGHEPHGSPNPNLNGLCHAWLAGAGAEHGKARSNPAFSVLVDTAGGSGAVRGFCTEMIASHPSGDDSDEPEPDDTDSPGPHATPSHPDSADHPNSTDHPNRSSHPGGRP